MRGFQTATAAILGGLANRSSQPGFMRQAMELISSPSNDRGILDNVRGLISGRGTASLSEGLGGRMLSTVFGGQQSRVADGISEASGLRPSSATTILGIAAPLVMGYLGKRVQEDHLDASGLSNLLQGQSSEVRKLLPSGLLSTVESASGVVTETAARARGAVSDTASGLESAYRTTVEARPSPSRWVWPLALGALALLAALWFFNRGRGEASRMVDEATDHVRSTAANVANYFHVRLPGGVDLNVPQNGVESRLVAFIQDSSRPVDSTSWFEFNRLSFETNSATILPQSHEELGNIAAILKAYPNAHVKIGGYTDNTGDPAANRQLSQSRAEAVKAQLESMGVAPDRMEAEGYGEQYPIGDNSTLEGRARNRRVAILVTQK
jgi:outer membrane protein OmpA-like peptidoglycan-associated protein